MSDEQPSSRRVLVTGGGGYVGAQLVPSLLAAGHAVTVLDTFWYGIGVLGPVAAHPTLQLVTGDIRSAADVRRSLSGCTDVIHLACISNDPSYDLDPTLGREINYTAFAPLVALAKDSGVTRFIYASSSSVYGVKDEPEVTEDLPLTPLTDYSTFKAQCEEILLDAVDSDFTGVIVRPATVCGYSPRQRLDLTVNILTNHAVNRGVIRVFGGSQYRPNLHIDDMCRAYLQLLAEPAERLQGQVFNIGSDNLTVDAIAQIVQANTPAATDLVHEATDDLRSYRISSQRIRDALGFEPRLTVADAVRDLVRAFSSGLLPDAMTDPRYINIARMREVLEGLPNAGGARR